MTIASEIQRINSNIENAYSACETKGATLPELQNSENLTVCINSIPEGESAKQYNVDVSNFIGSVDENGNLQRATATDFIGTGIKKVDDYILSNFIGGNAYGVSQKLGIKSFTFPDLTYVGNAAMYQFCTYNSSLTSVSFPVLEEIGQCGMEKAFYNCTALTSVSFPKLKTMSGMYSGLSSAFARCTKLAEITFDSLEVVNQSCFTYAFQYCTSLKNVSFPSLNESSFGEKTNQFTSMLQGVTGCTVHFPIAIENIISSWSEIIKGFSGTNTIVLFDLKRATLEFTTSTTADIYLRGKKLESTIGYASPGTANYLAYSSSLNALLSGSVSDLVADETTNVSVNFSQTSNKITIHTGVSGLTVSFTIDGYTFTAIEESSGNYSMNFINCLGKTLSYLVDGEDGYIDASGTINITDSSVTENVSLITATISTFTRPILTSNGTVGGDSFAVYSTNTVSGYYTYAVADSTTTNYVWLQNNSGSSSDLCFYNPQPLKVSALGITTTSTSYSPTKIDVYGSNDGSLWTLISNHTVSSSTSYSITPNSTKFYKYHKLTLTGWTLRIKELTITATQKG